MLTELYFSLVGETYLELSHSLDDYPALVKVRANMIDGLDPGWYTDAQGGFFKFYMYQ
jgi:hypothetical protein